MANGGTLDGYTLMTPGARDEGNKPLEVQQDLQLRSKFTFTNAGWARWDASHQPQLPNTGEFAWNYNEKWDWCGWGGFGGSQSEEVGWVARCCLLILVFRRCAVVWSPKKNIGVGYVIS